MKYALLIYNTQDASELPEDEFAAIIREYQAILDQPGVVIGAQLHDTESTTTVRVEDGETLLSDGPFVDAKEHFGGLYVLDADDLDAATALAARIPAARMGGAIEVRPIVEW